MDILNSMEQETKPLFSFYGPIFSQNRLRLASLHIGPSKCAVCSGARCIERSKYYFRQLSRKHASLSGSRLAFGSKQQQTIPAERQAPVVACVPPNAWPEGGRASGKDYLLNAYGHDTTSLITAKHRLNANQEVEGRQLAAGWFHTFPLSGPGEAGEFVLLQEFSPWNLVRLQPGPAQSRQVVYVKNAAFDFRGDTLACYTLTYTDNTCRMVEVVG